MDQPSSKLNQRISNIQQQRHRQLRIPNYMYQSLDTGRPSKHQPLKLRLQNLKVHMKAETKTYSFANSAQSESLLHHPLAVSQLRRNLTPWTAKSTTLLLIVPNNIQILITKYSNAESWQKVTMAFLSRVCVIQTSHMLAELVAFFVIPSCSDVFQTDVIRGKCPSWTITYIFITLLLCYRRSASNYKSFWFLTACVYFLQRTSNWRDVLQLLAIIDSLYCSKLCMLQDKVFEIVMLQSWNLRGCHFPLSHLYSFIFTFLSSKLAGAPIQFGYADEDILDLFGLEESSSGGKSTKSQIELSNEKPLPSVSTQIQNMGSKAVTKKPWLAAFCEEVDGCSAPSKDGPKSSEQIAAISRWQSGMLSSGVRNCT